MPANEFNAWATFYRLFPFGDVRGDLQAGVVASVVANVNRGRGTSAFNPADFMPQFGADKPVTQDDIIARRIDTFMRVYH